MAIDIRNISGVASAAAQRLIYGALRPKQQAVLRAWQSKQLPESAQHFMDAIRAGVQKTGRACDVNKVAASQLPDNLAGRLASLNTRDGVNRFAAQILYDAPQAGQTNLAALANRAVLPAVQTDQVSQALSLSVSQGSPSSVMKVLSMLPPKVAQSILNERNAAINAFLKSWTEDLALNAELDAKAAKKNAELAAQQQLTLRHSSELARSNVALNVKKASAQQDQRKLDASSNEFPKKLLTQRTSVLKHTVVALGLGSVSLVEQSLNIADRGDAFVGQLAPLHNVATLSAIDMPEEDIGPKLGLQLGLKRGLSGIQG